MAIPKLLDLMRNSASKEYVDNNGGSFKAEYGVTTYEEIVEAFNQGKVITCDTNSLPENFSRLGGSYNLVTYPNGNNNELYFYNNLFSATNGNQANTQAVYVIVNSGSGWSCGAESFSNLFYPLALDPSSTTTPFYESDTKRYYRPIICSTSEPTASDGDVGDIWIQYEEE